MHNCTKTPRGNGPVHVRERLCKRSAFQIETLQVRFFSLAIRKQLSVVDKTSSDQSDPAVRPEVAHRTAFGRVYGSVSIMHANVLAVMSSVHAGVNLLVSVFYMSQFHFAFQQLHS